MRVECPDMGFRQLAAQHGRALFLNLRLEDRRASLAWSLGLYALHLLGLLAVVRLAHQPLLLVWLAVLLVQPIIVSLKRGECRLLPESFAPLGLAYGVLALRLLLAISARARGVTSGSLVVPEPWGGLLSLNAAMALSGSWVVLAQAGPTAQAMGRRVRWISRRELATRHWRALSLDLAVEDLPLRHTLALLAAHLLSLWAIARTTGQRSWLPLAAVLLIQPLAVSARRRELRLLPESLAPLGLAYGVLLLRLVVAGVAYAQGLAAEWPAVPGPWAGWLRLDVAAALAGLWVLLAQAGPTAEAFGRRVDWKRVLGYGLAVLALVWSAVTFLGIHTKGVTGSDPYAYAQMAVDIARHGTPLHTFGRVPQVAEWGLPLEAVVHVGYALPDPQTGVAATVWPPGHSAILAIGYWLAGERGLYLTTPVLGLAALMAMWGLALEVLRAWPEGRRILAAGVAVFVLATSYEQVSRILVPMADVSSQLFTILAVLFALRAARARTFPFALLSGLSLGAAFASRYTQVLVAVGVLILFLPLRRRRSWRTMALAVACAGAAAFLMATPVLWYHRVAFGGPFRVGSSELESFALTAVPETALRMVKEFCRASEYFYVVPLLAWGAVQLWRRSRRPAAGLLTWLVVVVAFHLPYEPLRLRDLASVFPVLALWTGVGAADILSRVEHIGRPAWRRVARVTGLCLTVALLWARSGPTLQLPIPPMHFNTFGYLLPEQRAAFDTLSALVPPQAIVASSLNSGPIELYADRDTVRPIDWSQDEWLDFVRRALEEGYDVYLLADGVEMRAPSEAVRSRHDLVPVSSLPIPYFYPGGGSANEDVPLYRIESRD